MCWINAHVRTIVELLFTQKVKTTRTSSELARRSDGGKKYAYLAGKEAIKITEIASSFSSRLRLQMDFIKAIRLHMHH